MFDLEVVLSLFDGAGMGQEALKRAGITYRQYLASEIDKPAMRVAMRNHPYTTQLGDIRELKGENLPPISLLMGGSPCQGFSYANTSKDRGGACDGILPHHRPTYCDRTASPRPCRRRASH